MKRILLALICFQKVFLFRAEKETSRRRILRQEDTNSSCTKGWYTFGNMCYKLGGDKKIRRLPWDQAAQICQKNYEGNLATIDTKELSDFLVTFFLLSAKEDLWFGLHDRINESNYNFEDGTPVTSSTFFNWEPQEPSGVALQHEDCVELVILSIHHGGKPGQWNDNDCGQYRQFICQKKKAKYDSEYSDPRFCTSEVGKGWKKNASCFYIVEEQKNWTDAESYCIRNYGGHLVTITDFTINLFLGYILQGQEKNMWIGITTKNEFQQQWSSGWYVSYENWAEGEKPYDFGEGSCASRNPDGKWVIHSCNKMLPFFCEYSTDKPSVMNRTLEGAACPDGPADWRDLGGDFCYYFDLKNIVNWYEANFRCLRRGGTLGGNHSPEESLVLQNFLKFMQTTEPHMKHYLHIGLHRDFRDTEFAWADGKPYDFQNWDHSEGENELEYCTVMNSYTMKWHDVGCAHMAGYVCSILKVPAYQVLKTEGSSTEVLNQTVLNTSTTLNGYSTNVLIAVIIGVLLIASFVGVIIFFFGFRKYKKEINLQMHYRKYGHGCENGKDDDLYANVI